jgi:hypothetical protein
MVFHQKPLNVFHRKPLKVFFHNYEKPFRFFEKNFKGLLFVLVKHPWKPLTSFSLRCNISWCSEGQGMCLYGDRAFTCAAAWVSDKSVAPLSSWDISRPTSFLATVVHQQKCKMPQITLVDSGALNMTIIFIGHVVHYVPLKSYTIVWVVYRRSE